jgi:hypothetical protein
LKRSKRSRTVWGWQRTWQAISPGRRPSQLERNHLGALLAIVRGVMALGQLTDLGGFYRIRRGAGVAVFGHRKLFPAARPLNQTSIEERSMHGRRNGAFRATRHRFCAPRTSLQPTGAFARVPAA